MATTTLRLAFLCLTLAAALLAGACTPNATVCDPACGAGSECVAGVCVPVAEMPDIALPAPDLGMSGCSPRCAPPTPFCDAMQRCVACLEDTDCPEGKICARGVAGGTCVPGCLDDARCPKGQKCCDGGCIDVTSDPNHCGACETKCEANHARPACNAGACAVGQCDKGWGDCNMDGKDGCETNLRLDEKNCTACGMTCAIKNALTGCADGCYVKACAFGYDDCNLDQTDGCETWVEQDLKNCGACGNVCKAKPNGKVDCFGNSCVLTGCNQGFGNCDGDANNGCEINLNNNAQNCGACGAACGQNLICVNGSCTCQGCTLPGAKTKCVNLQCVFDTCLAGFANCDGNEANGCEVSINVDSKNCGACGNVCPMNTPTCVGGMCQNFRPDMLQCGATVRPISVFYPQNMGFNLKVSCVPDNNTQAMFVSRAGAGSVNGVTLQNYLNNGGIVLTEFNISQTIWNLAFGGNTAQGARNGDCQDTLPSVTQFTPNDPFWQANTFQASVPGTTGCGYAVGNYPGITPLAGWNANAVAVGYRDLGQGRVWATDFDWQDNEMRQPYQYTQQLMQYMALHRR